METKYAGFWWRFLAIAIDQIIVGSVAFLLMIPFFAAVGITIFNFSQSDPTDTEAIAYFGSLVGLYFLIILLTIAFEWLYFALLESSKHQGTLGKMICGLIVTDINGNRIKFGRATGRYFGKILSSFMFIGYIITAFTAKKQALHDLIAETLVIKK